MCIKVINNHLIAKMHTELDGNLSKTLAFCRHGDADISSKSSKNEAVLPTPVLFWVFTQLTESHGFSVESFFCLFL